MYAVIRMRGDVAARVPDRDHNDWSIDASICRGRLDTRLRDNRRSGALGANLQAYPFALTAASSARRATVIRRGELLAAPCGNIAIVQVPVPEHLYFFGRL